MCARPYDNTSRRVSGDQTRTRILEAARELLVTAAPDTRFSIEAVARRAGVARMTVYYQFESRAGLIEALFDDFALRADVSQIGAAMSLPSARDALAALIAFFMRWWESDRVLQRRLRAEAALDRELAAALANRDSRKRAALRALVMRSGASGHPGATTARDAEDLLFALTSFGFYDELATESRDAATVADMVTALALNVLDAASPNTVSR